MSVRCVIQNRNTRIFGRCIHCLNKISDEFVYIQVYLDGLILRVINIACSAFANFAFGVSFFSNYDHPDSDKDSGNAIANYKISIKGLFHIFKFIGNIDKQVENCIIELNSNEFVSFILECKFGITKQFKLPVIDFETLQTFCQVDSLSNSISCNSKLMSLAFSIFSKNDDEVKMVLTKDSFTFRNYDEGIHNLNSSIHTQTSLDKTEFFTFNIQKETALIFCSREFRFVLTLSDQLGQDLDISFDSPSEPILIKLKSDKNYEITFIISTIADTATDSMRTNSIASPVASSQQFNTLNKSGAASADGKIDVSLEKHRSPKSNPFDFEPDLPARDINNSFFDRSKTNSLFSPQKTPASHDKSHPPTNNGADILVDDGSQSPPLSQRFRAEILADIDYDYFNESLENAYILAGSDEEPYAL